MRYMATAVLVAVLGCGSDAPAGPDLSTLSLNGTWGAAANTTTDVVVTFSEAAGVIEGSGIVRTTTGSYGCAVGGQRAGTGIAFTLYLCTPTRPSYQFNGIMTGRTSMYGLFAGPSITGGNITFNKQQ